MMRVIEVHTRKVKKQNYLADLAMKKSRVYNNSSPYNDGKMAATTDSPCKFPWYPLIWESYHFKFMKQWTFWKSLGTQKSK